MKSDAVRVLQLKAMQAVLKPDSASYLRQIHRWFSKTFATPLSAVYDLPVDFVLQHYYESHYWEMEDKERAVVVRDLTETEAEKTARLIAEEAEVLSELELLKLMGQTKKKLSELTEVANKKDDSELAQVVASAIASAPALESLLKSKVVSKNLDPNDIPNKPLERAQVSDFKEFSISEPDSDAIDFGATERPSGS